jgi:predicted metal-dependent hydrolase
VGYRFERRRRRTFALAVNHDGLRVLAPRRAPMCEVEAFLQEKSDWITRKLDEWAARGRPVALLGRTGESLPLFGRTLALDVAPGAQAVLLQDDRILVRTNDDAADLLKEWIRARALETFTARAAHFAARIDLPPPPVALMDARTRWGSCSARGRIRLAWRLAHLEPSLSDYVVAHEVAHLREMNHSRRFWTLVETLYPEHRAARRNLRRAGAALPLL